jgi:hypothetical protein
MRVIFILNEIWTQYNFFILVGSLLDLNILLMSYFRYGLRTVSSTPCRRLSQLSSLSQHAN